MSANYVLYYLPVSLFLMQSSWRCSFSVSKRDSLTRLILGKNCSNELLFVFILTR
jgi:hypothetical protein